MTNIDDPISIEEAAILSKIALKRGHNAWWQLDGTYRNYTLVHCLICNKVVGYWDNINNTCKPLNIHMRKHLKLMSFL